VGIDLRFWREASFPIWEQISKTPQDYNALVDGEWAFDQIEGRARARMFLDFAVPELRKESSWPEVYKWICEKLSLVYERVTPKLRDAMDKKEPVCVGARFKLTSSAR
jgi:hypothetical protein